MPEARLPEVVYAQAVPWPPDGRTSLFALDEVNTTNVLRVTVDDDRQAATARRLRAGGFTVLQVSDTSINIAGPPSLYERVFGCELRAERRPQRASDGAEGEATFVDCADAELPGLIGSLDGGLDEHLAGVAIEQPRVLFAGPVAPKRPGWHLSPSDLAVALNAERVHRMGVTGWGVSVALLDTGFEPHAFFTRRGYRVDPVVLAPGTANDDEDPSGHGTAMAANVFAAAPDVRLTVVKTNLVNTTAAVIAATRRKPDVIVCTWGGDLQEGPPSAADRVLATAISRAVADRVTVVCAAGNGHFGFPGQHPDVISVGGAYLDADDRLRASDAASGFASPVFEGRRVPDVAGLAGPADRGDGGYLLLPVPPGSRLGRARGDGRTGWAALGGTSAAAAQAAGICALVKQVFPDATPGQVRGDVTRARDVAEGRCFPDRPGMGNPAVAGEADLATGHGVLDGLGAIIRAGQEGTVFIRGPIPTSPW
jgi:hypothetical protein